MTPELLDQMRAHAARDFPREACGLVIQAAGALSYRACRNLADGQAHFVMSPEDIAAAESSGQLVAVVHSHPNAAPEPSQADLVMMERWGVPWFIVGWPTGEVREHRPSGYHAPLLGRVFSHGVLDCFALVRDYYAEALGLELPDFERGDDWWLKGGNLYLDNFERAGFVDVTGQPLREHDVPLMELRAKVPNHAGVLLDRGVLLHHVMGRLSRREAYAGFWERITRKVVRHRSLC
jgi:proteasome lid subunit RPN8/RPN11